MISAKINGVRYHIRNKKDVIQGCLLSGKQWNNEIVAIIKNYITVKQCKHFLNVGSHIGSVALPISSCISKVTAIEAYPPTYEYLCQNIELNGITNVRTFNTAVGNSEEPVYFMGEDSICPKEHINRVQNNTGGMHVFTETDIENQIRSSVLTDKKIVGSMKRLDSMDIDAFDIMLVDIEGCEYEFLLGAEHKITTNKPIILIEIWGDGKRRMENMSTTANHVIDYIVSLGYILVRQIGDDYIFEPLDTTKM
jgi:FkbM family methyltransferase